MDIIEILKEYGIAGIAFILHAPMYKYWLNNRKVIDSIPDLKKEVENVHFNCLIKPESIEAIKTDVTQLKIENGAFDAKLVMFFEAVKTINTKLDILIEKQK